MNKMFRRRKDGLLSSRLLGSSRLSSSKLLSADFNAGQGSIRNGLVSSGNRGFDMYKSNNIASISNAAGKCLGGHISSIATVSTIAQQKY